VTADGEPVELLANINSLADAEAATKVGATGVGLYRTEYLFLTHRSVPTEREQIRAYRDIIAASPNHTVTIRTLDVGGDKTISYLGTRGEANPFMGWRSIRLSFEHPALFTTQIRAVMRAAAPQKGLVPKVRLMFPMITTLEEMRRARSLVKQARRQLEKEKKPAGELLIGPMLEVPAAAVAVDDLLDVSDFVSIGSNDLVQYLMAADRDNPKVSHLCQPLSPPVLRTLNAVISACIRARKPVTLCGEMAGSTRAFVLLFGMGLRSFSMSPAFIPSIRELVAHLTKPKVNLIFRQAMEMKTSRSILRYMTQQIDEVAPNLKLLDLT
jgi:phosphotransferase system enzyme I (PtsI)